jgi:hypothetical protein
MNTGAQDLDHLGVTSSGGAMAYHTSLVVLFVIFALGGCAQGVTGQAQAPHSPQNNENTQDRGGGGGY